MKEKTGMEQLTGMFEVRAAVAAVDFASTEPLDAVCTVT